MSNWFGNKRIRYKKNIVKAQEEANTFATKKAIQLSTNTNDDSDSGGTGSPYLPPSGGLQGPLGLGGHQMLPPSHSLAHSNTWTPGLFEGTGLPLASGWALSKEDAGETPKISEKVSNRKTNSN